MFCEPAKSHHAVLEFFAGKVFGFFLFCLSGDLMVCVAFSHQLLYPNDDAARASLPHPQLLVVHTVRFVFCGFCFFLPVMLLSEILKLLTDKPVRGFPTVWKLLLIHDSLLRMGLCP